MIELFVEGQKVDINESFSTMLNFAIDDVKDWGAKNTNFSKTIIIPGTTYNNLLFGNIFNPSTFNDYAPTSKNILSNYNPAVSARAIIFADNIQVFKGVFRILEIIADNEMIEYECAVFGELSGFADMLGNKKLEDLDFSAYDHTYNTTNITGSWNTINGSSYYYPLIDYGGYSTAKKDWEYKTFRPALYVKEYLDKIITATGYTVTCDFFNTTMFKRLIVPHNQKTLKTISTKLFDATFNDTTIASPVYIPTTVITAGSFTGTNPITYSPATGTTVNVTCTVIGSIAGISAAGWVTFYLKKNGTTINSITRYINTTPTFYNANLNTNGITIATGDTLAVEISSNVTSFDCDGGVFKVDSTVAVEVPVNRNDTVNMNYCIPKGILQKDFFTSILKMFNLYVFEDYNFEKSIVIKPFVDYYATGTSFDWSLKLDRSKPIRLKPMSELNSRYFEFNYKDDSDYYNTEFKKRYNVGYGSYIYDSQYEFAKESQTVGIIFSGTPIVGYTGEDKKYSTIFKKSGTTEEAIDSNIRILQAKKISCTSYAIKDGATTLTSPTSYGYAGHFDDPTSVAFDLNFAVLDEYYYTGITGTLEENVFNNYWSNYLSEIIDKDSRLLTAYFKLDFKDIYNFDFSTTIWVDGVLYRVNRIYDFNATNIESCKVELLKIINKVY